MGRTPDTIAAVEYARELGARAPWLVTCNPDTPLGKRAAELAIVVDVGPEVVAGSTRMKAGTAQKMVLKYALHRRPGSSWATSMAI